MKPGRAKRGEPLAFPDDLAARLLRLYSNPGAVVLDPFAGSGTTGRVALLHGRVAWLIEREPSYWPRLEAVIGQAALVVAGSERSGGPEQQLGATRAHGQRDESERGRRLE